MSANYKRLTNLKQQTTLNGILKLPLSPLSVTALSDMYSTRTD